MDAALKRLVWDRAGDACEYCGLPQSLDVLPFQIDHIIAEKHHGPTVSAASFMIDSLMCEGV